MRDPNRRRRASPGRLGCRGQTRGAWLHSLAVPSNMLAVHFDQPGGAENLYVKEVARPIPGPGEVLLKVAASALNRADLLQVPGSARDPPAAASPPRTEHSHAFDPGAPATHSYPPFA